MIFSVAEISREQASKLYPTLITPRPVMILGTYDAGTRRANLAPYSSVSLVANNPPVVAVSFSESKEGDHRKETLRLAQSSGEFVVNVATRAQSEIALNAANSADTDDDPDDYVRIRAERSEFGLFEAGRIADCPVALGCRVTAAYPLSPSRCTLLVATVELIYVAEDWQADGDQAAIYSDVLAGIAGERYVGLGSAEDFYAARTWD